MKLCQFGYNLLYNNKKKKDITMLYCVKVYDNYIYPVVSANTSQFNLKCGSASMTQNYSNNVRDLLYDIFYL